MKKKYTKTAIEKSMSLRKTAMRNMEVINNTMTESEKVAKDQLAQSYSFMRQQTAGWNHLMGTIAGAREKVVQDMIDNISMENLTANEAAYVKGWREFANYVLRKIAEASRGRPEE